MTNEERNEYVRYRLETVFESGVDFLVYMEVKLIAYMAENLYISLSKNTEMQQDEQFTLDNNGS
jgi:hypothetical protein